MTKIINNLTEAEEILRNKKGTGKAKHTSVKIEMDFNAGLLPTIGLLAGLEAILTAYLVNGNLEGEPTYKKVKINKLETMVESDLFDNPNAIWSRR